MTDGELELQYFGLQIEYARYTKLYLDGDTVPRERAKLVKERIQELRDEYNRRREAVKAEAQPVDREELNEEEKQELDATVVEPYRAKVAVKDLQAGDIAVRDGEAFVIEEIEIPDVGTADQDNKGVNRVNVKGYYPGHQSQERNWFANLEIEVVREAQVPEKGDQEPLVKPELADYGPLKKQDGKWGLRNKGDQERYDNDYADFVANVAAAAEGFDDPTALQGTDRPNESEVAKDKPEDGPFIVTDVAENLQAGDISRKDHFVITRVFRDEKTKPGSVSIEGYYPGYGLQRKEWKADTSIEVVRGVPENELPEMGEGSLHRPAGRGPRGGWYPLDDPELNRQHQEKLQEARDRWVEPENLPVVAAQDAKGEEQLQEPPKQPKAPFLPSFPPFQGFFADLANRVGRNWKAFRDGLKDREIIVFDFETTGIMPEDGNEPYQIGYRKIVNGKEVATGGIYFQPGRSIKGTYAEKNAKGPDGNPLTDEFLEKQMTQEEAFQWIKDKFGDNALLVAHNAKFDVEILERKFKEFGIDFQPEGIADTMAMAEQFYKDDPVDENDKPRKKNLKAVATWLDIELENWHDADADVAATAAIFNKLIDKGIAEEQGLDALDADARQAEQDQKMQAAQPAVEAYEKAVADYWAQKAVFDAAAGKDVDLDEVQENIKNSRPIPEGPIDNGQPLDEEGVEPEQPQADLVDVEADSVFQGGKMRIAVKEFVNNPIRVEQLFRGEIKVENLRPGDFVRPKRDSDEFWQVVAIRAGEDFDITGNRVLVYVQNDEGKQLKVRWRRNAFLDEVRRPRNRADLVAGENDPVANPEPDRKPNQAIAIPVDVAAGQGYVRMSKDGDDFLAEVILNDEEGNPLYNMTVRRAEAAEAERIAKAAVKEFGRALASQRRQEAGEPEPQEQSIAVGDEPANAGEIPIVEQIDNLPFGKGENEVTPKPEEDGVKYESNARVMDDDGEVQAQVVEDFPNENAALEGGQKNIEEAAQDIADRIADRNRLASEGRGRRNLPEIPEKYRRQVYIRLLAGLYADADGNPLAVGDRVIHTNPNKAAKYGEGVVVNKVQGKIGGLQRAGVVYVDYVIVEYPDGSRRKFASRFQRHLDADVAKQRFQAEDRINWMNEDQMKEALEERRKKNRKNKQDPAVDAADAQAEQIAEEVKEATQAPATPEASSEPVEIPDLPRAKTIKLPEAKKKVRGIAQQLLDIAEGMSDKELEDLLRDYRGGRPAINARDRITRVLRNAAERVDDRRRRNTWEADLELIIQRAEILGQWDLIREIRAAANLKDSPELRPQGEEFNNKMQNLQDKAVDYLGAVRSYKENIVGGRGPGNKLEKALEKMINYPDAYNPDFRRAFGNAKGVLDDLVVMNNITNDVDGDAKIRELADLINQIGPLPKLPEYDAGEAEKEFKALDEIRAPLIGKGYTLDDFANNAVPGFVYEFDISDGINQVLVVRHEASGKKIVVKKDGDTKGIQAEEMVAQLYRDLGFAQPAVRVIDPDGPERANRVAFMEFADDGFFGLEGLDQIRAFPEVQRGDLNKIAPENRAELLNFVVANGLVGNGDRHRGNAMLGRDADGFYRVVPIDNGLAMANGAFGQANPQIERGDYLGMLPEAFINGGYGNPNAVAPLAQAYIDEIGEDQAKSQIVEFAERMRARAEVLKFLDSRINDYLIARADYIIKNPGRILKGIERAT